MPIRQDPGPNGRFCLELNLVYLLGIPLKVLGYRYGKAVLLQNVCIQLVSHQYQKKEDQRPCTYIHETMNNGFQGFENAEMAWLIYRSSPLKRQQCMAFSLALGFRSEKVYFVNNDCYTLDRENEIAGDNRNFEFSGYVKALEQFSGEGPWLLVNDSLWAHHSVSGWKQILQDWLKTMQSQKRKSAVVEGIWGDLRHDGLAIDIKEGSFLASWIFGISGHHAKSTIHHSLLQVLEEGTVPGSPEYADYFKKWLRLPWWRGGWYGPLDEGALNRKFLCLQWEHRWSRHLRKRLEGRIHSFEEVAKHSYWWVRLQDRWIARWVALRNRGFLKHSFFR